ncbi:MAG: ABC-F family ATP-binding cassette domain-containing protein, partial [Planctomycetes bacterium]|nr:ABC-F family ATP-binding cassette domain-containing protein [Planctomycetota bacterium]
LQARRSQLEREKAKGVEKPKPDINKISPHFKTDPTRADIAMQVREYSKGFDVEVPEPGRLELFDSVNWDMAGGQRWALIGPNGCGKTTLLRDIVDLGNWRNPAIRIGPSLSVGYCSQQQEVLDGDNTVFEELMEIKDANREQVLGILARFLFKDEEVYKQIRYLSGGERNRLQLARLMLLKSNFLILDEPTNHLDIPTREAVEQALAEFEGTILVVSHDRYFLDKVVDHVAEVKDRQLHFYEGNFTDYWQTRIVDPGRVSGRISQRSQSVQRGADAKDKQGGKAWEQRKAQSAVLRKARKMVENIEQQIHDAELQKEKLEQEMAQAFTTGDNQRGQQLSMQFKALSSEIESYYRQWEQAEKELKNIESDSDDISSIVE